MNVTATSIRGTGHIINNNASSSSMMRRKKRGNCIPSCSSIITTNNACLLPSYNSETARVHHAFGLIGDMLKSSSFVEAQPLTPAMDIFSAGCVVMELFLNGKRALGLGELMDYRRFQKLTPMNLQQKPRHCVQHVVTYVALDSHGAIVGTRLSRQVIYNLSKYLVRATVGESEPLLYQRAGHLCLLHAGRTNAVCLMLRVV